MALFDFIKDAQGKPAESDKNIAPPVIDAPPATPLSLENPAEKPPQVEKSGLLAFLKRKKPLAAAAPVPSEIQAPIAQEPSFAAAEPATAGSPMPQPIVATPAASTTTDEPDKTKTSLFSRIKYGLSRTGSAIGSGVGTLLLGKKAIDAELIDELETRMLVADVGIDATGHILSSLTQRIARKELSDGDALYQALQDDLYTLLQASEAPLNIPINTPKPFVILVIGVNGAGKTTTIGKLAQRLQREGRSVLLAAGDTFRAAAVEQLQVWGERNAVTVIAQHTGADSASVIFDAVQAAQARGIDVVIADTAGRLHNKSNLMEELKKVKRVMAKLDLHAPHEVLLVLDAGTGQNAINQAQQFHTAIGVTGIALTKLDGTAKGGVIFAIAQTLKLPIRFIGIGEQIDDLQTFNARDFIRALFDKPL